MKATLTLSLLASGVFLCATGPAEAQQWMRTRSFRRVVIAEPTYNLGRPVVTQPVVTYGGFSHVDDLAVEMEQHARDILWEMHFNYAHNLGYKATYAEAYGMLNQAKAIHQAEHHGNRATIVRVASDLDRLFHHIEGDVRNWRAAHNHVVGNGNLFDKLEAMEITLHHLMQDVGVAASTSDPPAPGLNGNPPPPQLGNGRI